MTLKLFGVNVSPFVRKVRVVCAEKSLDCTLHHVSPLNPPDGWRKLSPLGKIPVLDHDGKIVNDSRVICAYLELIEPEPRLYPADPYDYAQALWLQEFTEGAIAPAGQAPEFLPFNPIFSKGEPTAADIEAADKVFQQKIAPLLAYMEDRLGAQGYLVGDALSVADISLASALVNARLAGFPPDAHQFPKLTQFLERMHARPSFAACIAEEKPIFGKRWR